MQFSKKLGLQNFVSYSYLISYPVTLPFLGNHRVVRVCWSTHKDPWPTYQEGQDQWRQNGLSRLRFLVPKLAVWLSRLATEFETSGGLFVESAYCAKYHSGNKRCAESHH